MSEVKGAARRTDLIEHGAMKGILAGKIAKALFNTASTAYTIYRVAKLAALGAPGPGWVFTGASFVVEFAVGKAIDKGVEWYNARNRNGVPGVATGSPNVFINKLEGVRGQEADKTLCHTTVMQGSQWVTYNKKPATRLDDLTKCPGSIATASQNVAIGGPPTEYNPYQALDNALLVLRAYNSFKTGAFKAAVQAGSTATSVMGKGALGASMTTAGELVGKRMALPWAKEQGLWPW